MTRSLAPRTIELVKATVPALEAHGMAIVQDMYDRMFRDPAIRDLFNLSHHGASQAQPRALTGAILAYAANIENLAALRRLRGQGFTQTVAAISRDDDDRDQIVQRGADTAFQVYDGAGASLADRAAEAAILTDPRDQGPDGLEDPGTTR